MTNRLRSAHIGVQLAALLSITSLSIHEVGAAARRGAEPDKPAKAKRPGQGGVPASRRSRGRNQGAGGPTIGQRGVLSLQRRATPEPQAVPEIGAAAEAAADTGGPTRARTRASRAKKTPPTARIKAEVVVPKIEGTLAAATTRNPGHVILVGDLSPSMYDPWAAAGDRKGGGSLSTVRKIDEVKRGLEAVAAELVDISKKDGVVRDKFDVSIVGYSQHAETMIPGGDDTVSVSELAGLPERVNIDAISRPDGTEMDAAFEHVREVARDWRRRPAGPHPVLVVHVTDGQYTDRNPKKEIKQLATEVAASGGQLLVTNVHISEDNAKQLIFPTADEVAALNDPFAMELFENSSEIPDELARKLRLKDPAGRRMFAFNAQPPAFLKVLRAGSSVAAKQ